MIKESCNLIEREVHLDTLIHFRDINVKKILQSDWPRDITGHAKPKVVVSHATFPS